MQLAILGRQAPISLAELEALFGADAITPLDDYGALVQSEEPLPQNQLGGTMKSAALLKRLEHATLADAFIYLRDFIPEHLRSLPEGKLQFGVSIYGLEAQRDWLLRQMLALKKIIKKTGQSVRIIENKGPALESAQVLYNKLTGPLGWEILFVRDGNSILICQTTAVQNIDDYSKRDFDRPKRDAYVGMLPPKLAQIMINLALGSKPSTPKSLDATTANSLSDYQLPIVLDPFCGTGVVLQEAMLMHYPVYGSDISEKMVSYSRDNLNWLQDMYPMKYSWHVEEADATKHRWRQPIGSVVGEVYLGTPLSALPSRSTLETIASKSNVIAEKFLKNISPQLQPGTKLCLALPAWYLGNERFKQLAVLDHLQDLGYNRLEFVHAKRSELIYHRPDQVVARELTILEKI